MCITHSECVSVALSIQHEINMLHIICDLSGCTIFSTLSHRGDTIRKKVIEYKNLFFDFLYNFCLKHFLS